MGAICGFISKEKLFDSTIFDMANSLVNKGNNVSYNYLSINNKNLGISQRLLDIEMINTSNNVEKIDDLYICFTGEIINKNELKELLEIKIEQKVDNRYIIAKLYRKYDDKVFEHINGGFSIFIYDISKDRVLFARDKAGKEPLYYMYKDKNLIFSSDLKVFLKNPLFEKKIRKDVIKRYLCRTYINSPETIFEDVYKLKNGEYVIIQSDVLKKHRYWNYYLKYQKCRFNKEYDYSKCKNNLKELIFKAVNDRLEEGKTVSTFLSGGIDSSLVTSIANSINKNKLNTFSIGFYDEKLNEAVYANNIAKYLKTNHIEEYITNEKAIQIINNIPKFYSEPFSDPSQIPSLLVNDLARRNGVDYVLTGDGADQIFIGSTIYDREAKVQKKKLKYYLAYLLYLKILNNPNIIDNKYDYAKKYIYNRDKRFKTQFDYTPYEEIVDDLVRGKSIDIKYDIEKNIKESNFQMKRLLLDMETFVPQRILTKTNNSCIGNQVENRYPFLDEKIIEYSFKIPQKYKYFKGEKKYILKDILNDFIPKELVDRPKLGFGIPLCNWLNTFLWSDILKYSNKNAIEEQGIFNYEKLQEIIKEYKNKNDILVANVLYAFYMFELWYKEYIEDLWKDA